MSTSMRTAALVAVAHLVGIASAYGQTGSIKNAAALNAEVSQFFPDQNAGLINPFNTRQMLLDIIASVNLSGTGTFGSNGGMSGQITLNGSTSGSAILAASPVAALSLASQTGQSIFLNDGTNGTVLQLSGVGSVIANNWLLQPAVTGAAVKMSAQGTDTNITMQIVNKGAAPIQLNGTSPTWSGLWLGGVGVGNGAATLIGNTSGSFAISASATGVPTMSTPWPVAAGGTGDNGSPWTAFTPSPSCGTATFTVNSARSKSLGKTVFIEVDFLITAIGTCTSGPVLFTPPSNTNSTSVLAGFNPVAARFFTLACFTTGGSSQFSCIQNAATAFAVNDRIIAGGVYESP